MERISKSSSVCMFLLAAGAISVRVALLIVKFGLNHKKWQVYMNEGGLHYFLFRGKGVSFRGVLYVFICLRAGVVNESV